MKVAVFLCAVLAFAYAADKEAESNGVKIKIMGSSGKMSITKDGAKAVHFEYDALRELGADDIAVKATKGSEKHSVNSFASQSFSMTGPTDKKIPSEVGEGPMAVAIDMSGTLDIGSTMKSFVYIAKEAGNVTFDGETNELEKGSVKFSIELSNWNWCTLTNCDKDGAFVEIDIAIKAPKEPSDKPDKEEKGKPVKFSLGDGVAMELSKKVRIDNTWEDMPTGYPKVRKQGAKTIMTLRFKKFNNNAFYDPTVEYGGDSNGASGLAFSMVTMLLAAIYAMY